MTRIEYVMRFWIDIMDDVVKKNVGKIGGAVGGEDVEAEREAEAMKRHKEIRADKQKHAF